MPDLLIYAHHTLRPVFKRLPQFGRNWGRSLYRWLLDQRYGRDRLALTTQNGRQWWLSPQIALRGEWQEFETIQAFRRVVTSGMDVIDVGANVGQMTLELAHLVGATGRVLAVEPGPGNLKLLHRHVEGNDMGDRVTICPLVCTDQPGQTVNLNIFGSGKDDVGSGFSIVAAHRIPNPTSLAVHPIAVPTTTIDALVDQYGLTPGFIKIDVEGAELTVLAGAQQTLATHRPILILGFHPFAFADPIDAGLAVRDRLRNAGYRLTTLEGTPVDYPTELAEYVAIPEAS